MTMQGRMRQVLTIAAAAALLAATAAAVAVGAIGGAPSEPEAAAEGIQVHGHWTIEVRDPDGTLAERREFENELLSGGAWHISGLLTRNRTQGLWVVTFGARTVGAGQTNDHPCVDSDGSPQTCFASEREETLVMTHIDTDSNNQPDAVLLEATLTAERDGVIEQVVSQLDGSNTGITRHALSDAVPVVVGQQILVTVEISFS